MLSQPQAMLALECNQPRCSFISPVFARDALRERRDKFSDTNSACVRTCWPITAIMTYNETELFARVAAYDQHHLLSYWEQLNTAEREQLAEQISTIDFELIQNLWQSGRGDTDWGALAARGGSPPGIRCHEESPMFNSSEARDTGEEALRSGQVGVVLVAGGQGSRLGFPHPKGMYQIGPVSGRTLFEIHIDRIRAAACRYGTSLPLYLMTSPATHEETVEYFAQHNNLGLSEGDLTIFCQGTMPAVDAVTGRLLLAAPDSLCLSPDGHGGTLSALVRSGRLAEMTDRGIRTLFYFQVDNPLVDVADPVFLGYHLLAKSELTSQVVAKTDPLERVGNVISVDGHLQVIEYSDLPDESARRRTEDGSLALWAGSIAVHAFEVSFLDRVQDRQDALPFHLARKHVPYLDGTGRSVDPEQPNAIKFERFIFDLLPLAENAIVVEVAEEEGFAPLKNASGAPKDTPESTRAAMVRQHKQWLTAAGVKVADNIQVEINPRYAIDLAELRERLPGVIEIDENTYFGPTG